MNFQTLDILERVSHVLIIILAAVIIQTVSAYCIATNLEDKKSKNGLNQKYHTFALVAGNAITWVVSFIAVLMCLERLHVPLKTLLAVSGIGALVIGIGARSVIRDFFASLLIVAETQLYHGEYVIIYGPVINTPLEGIVENITLRVTELRTRDGSLIFIPNGNITSIVNMSRGEHKIRIPFEVQPEMATPETLAAIKTQVEACRKLPYVHVISTLGITNIKKDAVEYTVVAFTDADHMRDAEAAIRKTIWNKLQPHLFQSKNLKPTTTATPKPDAIPKK